jgi:hypothetical protein
MNEVKDMTSQQKLAATQKLLDCLDELVPPEFHQGYKAELLVLAYHASTSTHDLRCLVSSI